MHAWRRSLVGAGLAGLAVGAPVSGVETPRLPAEPARIEVAVSPDPANPGSEVSVTVRLQPIDGVRINRYPKIKLEIDARTGVHAQGLAVAGNDAPPPPERINSDDNYFGAVDPLDLRLGLDPAAQSGRHEIEARLSYFFCIKESGICAPKRVPLRIPVTIR
jgi:hypothetical protein